MKNYRRACLAAMGVALLANHAHAQQKIGWWDYFIGGDGVRMKSIIEKFNASNATGITIEPTTLDFGMSYYSKVQTSVSVGQGPDLMTIETSRLPSAVDQNLLQEVTSNDLAAMGFTADDFSSQARDAVTVDGKQYAVPLDIHGIVLYYNKTKLREAGLLDENGLPKGLNGADQFAAALKKLKDAGSTWALSTVTADDFQLYTASSFLCQQNGEMMSGTQWLAGENKQKFTNALKTIASWVSEGYTPSNAEYPTSIALFTSGEAALLIQGVWEVPTFADLSAKGELGFDWGAIELPILFDRRCTYADFNSIALPNNAGRPMTAETRQAALKVIGSIAREGLAWASAGHIPALQSVVNSSEFKRMQPNATYSRLAEHIVLDPRSKFAGVASPFWNLAGATTISVVNGEENAADAVDQLQIQLLDLH